MHRVRVEDAYGFLLAKLIKYNEYNIFEFFSVVQQSGYCMIELRAPSKTYAHSNVLKTYSHKREVTSK